MPDWRITMGGVPMLRPDWYEFYSQIHGVVACACGSSLWDQQSTHAHWQMGHFDRPVEPRAPDVALWQTA